MPLHLQYIRRYFPLAVGTIILIVIGLLSPWNEIGRYISRIEPMTLYALAALSLTYYLAKAFRFWYILRALGVHHPLNKTALVYFAAQPVSILPAGELYRSLLIEKYFHTSLRKTAPAVTIQGLVEAVILLLFALVGAFLLGHYRVAVLSIGIALLALLVILQQGWLIGKGSWLNKLPFININHTKYDDFVRDHQKLLQPTVFGALLALSVIPVVCGTAILFLTAASIQVDLSFVEAAISYTLPVILSGLSFLPGGIGVGEGGTIGLLYIFGFSAAAAVTATLLMRFFTLIAGIIYGFAAQIITHVRMEER